MAKKRATSPARKPFIGSGILADATSETENKKVNCHGIFTIFYAWGFPCYRNSAFVITLFDLPVGSSSVVFSHLNNNKEFIRTIGTADISNETINGSATLVCQFPIELTSPERNFIKCEILNFDSNILLPFDISLREWPTFEKKEIDYASSHPNAMKTIRVNVQCKQCQRVFIFEESIIGDTISPGTTKFPTSGTIECQDCGHVLNLHDIQGQLRNTVKTAIQAEIKKGV